MTPHGRIFFWGILFGAAAFVGGYAAGWHSAWTAAAKYARDHLVP